MDATLPVTDRHFDQAACGLIVTDAHGMILRANAAIHAWLGYGPGRLVTLRVHTLFTTGARLYHHTRCAPLLQAEGTVGEVQLDLLSAVGERVPVLLNIVRRREDGLDVDHWAVFRSHARHAYENALLGACRAAEEALEVRHASEAQLQARNAQLAAADRRKDEFLATLSHELRNPLGPMRSALDVFKLRHGDGGDERLLLAFDRQLRHLTRLVDDLMEVSRITQDRMQLRRAPLDLGKLVAGAAQDMAPAMAAARHTLRLQLGSEPLVVDGDATRLAQVVINLLANAAKYTPDGGLIDVRLECAGDHAELRVRDNGIGIAPAALATVFDMFAQLAPGLERARGGLGIGLALARGIAELHGGMIRAESPGVGRGSEFILRLPLLLGCSAAEEAPPPARLASKLRVLVVDDNVDAAQTMALALELFGCETQVAHTAASALELVDSLAPDIALLDIGLPDFNGYELARRLRLQPGGRAITLIAATGWGQEKDRRMALEAGFDHHLTKPIDVEQLRLLLVR